MDRTRRAMPAACVRHTLRLIIGLAALLVGPAFAYAQPGDTRVIIGDVYISGLRSMPAEKAMNYVHSRPGTVFSPALIQEDVTRLAGSKMFKSIRGVKDEPRPDGRINLTFHVVEHPNIVREVVFLHAKHVNLKELEGMTRVQKGMPLDKTLNKLACFEITEHLKKNGYYFANVSLLEGHEETHERVVFNITEGPRVRVRRVDFIGQKELASGERLRTQIQTARALLGTFGGEFNPMMVDDDCLKLEEYYRMCGYLGVSVSRELRFSDDYLHVDIVFHIREGNRYRIHDWKLDGIKDFPREQLEAIIQAKKGEFVDEKVINTDVRNLTDYGGWRGHQFEVRKILTEVPEDPGTVRVQYLVQEQPQAYVGEVIIVGNTVTKDRVLRRVLGLYPGQVLRYPELRIAENGLARLGIFDINPELGIRPTVTALDSPGPYKDILVKINEARTGSFMLGAGISSNSGLVGSVTLTERNFDLFRFPTSFADFWEGKAFRGAGQELRIEAMPGTVVQRYSVSLREPFLFDQPYSLLLSGYYRDRIFNEYQEGRLGFRAGVDHLFTKEFAGGISFRGERVNVSQIAQGAPIDYTSVYGTNQLYAPGLHLVWDARDSVMRPSQGLKVDTTFEYALGSYNFPIFNLEASQYFTLFQRPDGSGKHILAFYSQFGIMGENAPVYERYFAGGYPNMRGFQYRGIGPNTNGFMVGGTFQFMNRVEYQIPIRASDNIYFATFLDTGTVESKAGITNYRVSAGFGFRINIPMLGPVPLALDFGFPINRAGSDVEQLFSFGVGIYP